MKYLMCQVVLITLLLHVTEGKNSILQELEKLNQYSQFLNLLKSSRGVHTAYLENYVTVFAPSNDAMNKYKGSKDENFILHHMASEFPNTNQLPTEVSSSVTEGELGERLTSLMQGHPPIWVRLVQNNVFLNQARVVYSYKDLVSKSGKKQVLYLIDSVLEPLVPKEDKVEDFIDIKASNILKESNKYKIGDFSIDKFAKRIEQLGFDKFPEFSQYGKMTFFLPIDSAFNNLRVKIVDEEVVRAHVVPDELLFTLPPKRRPELFPTLQYNFTRGISILDVKAKVTIKDDGPVVQSKTITGTKQHKRGTVEANIIKANIPVQNGIVHLIDRPLVIMANTLYEHLCVERSVQLRFQEFSKYLRQFPALCDKIRDTTDATILVPTNDAFQSIPPAELERRMTDDGDRIIGLHFLDHPPGILADDVRVNNPQSDSGVFSVPASYPANSQDKVWFWTRDGDLHIDGGGVDVSVVEANIGATNGVIHSINKVLGIPRDNMYNKLKTDPMMRKTFELGNQEHFNINNGFNKSEIKFTYLVPTDQAWEQLKTGDFASAYKILFMGEFYYQTHHILERHLEIGSKQTLKQLVDASENGNGIDVMRGPPLKLSRKLVNGEMTTFVNYDGVIAKIVRPDIECTNGYIHLIDKVVVKRRDITLGGSNSILPSLIAIALAWIISAMLK